jgi:hypothetical protein
MARAASRRLLKDLPTQDEMGRIMSELRTQNPYELAVLSVAYLEYALEKALKVRLAPLTKDDERRIFDGAANGILGTFSAKVRIAYAFNYLGPIAYGDLLLKRYTECIFSFVTSDRLQSSSHNGGL